MLSLASLILSQNVNIDLSLPHAVSAVDPVPVVVLPLGQAKQLD